MEPSGDERNLEEPATEKSRASPGSQTPRFWTKPSCICSRGERRKSFCFFFQSFCYFRDTETTYLHLQHPLCFRLRLFIPRGSTEPHRSCCPPHTPRGGSPEFDALQGRPDQSELRSHFRHEAGPIAAWLTQGRVTLRQPVPFRQRGKRNRCKRPRTRRPKVVPVARNARARQQIRRAPWKGRTARS